MNIPQKEEQRLAEIYQAIQRTTEDRRKKIAVHDNRTIELEQERLESVNWREKNDLSQKLVEHGHHDPRKYLTEFKCVESPYFAILGINDNNPRIGSKEYLIGRQSLMDGNHTAILDWRADISRLFYENYEEGEEYEETIHDVERNGTITRKDKVVIEKRGLRRIETSSDIYEFTNGEWSKSGANVTTADIKQRQQDHRMVDIVSLITPEQFQMISRESKGCTAIFGEAGSGKTTVGIHKLSFQQFNDPNNFRQDRCLVLMFNVRLQKYVQKTSQDLLGTTRVETFNSWALSALKALGATNFKIVPDDPYSIPKKRSEVLELLEMYVSESSLVEPIMDLWRFYCQDAVIDTVFDDPKEKEDFRKIAKENFAARKRGISFADSGILLRLCQMRRPADVTVLGALRWFDTITLDEAQDLSLCELEAVFAATSFRRSMTICADAKQKILDSNDGLSQFLKKLHSLGLDKISLTVPFRSAREIMELASRVSGRPVDTSQAPSGTLEYHKVTGPMAGKEALRKLVATIYETNPQSLTAIICKKKADIKEVQAALTGIDGLHPEGKISYDPGILVLNAHQVKGLEFTNVVLWNPSSMNYRNTEVERNLLYVAITRACKRLDILHWTPLAKAIRTK